MKKWANRLTTLITVTALAAALVIFGLAAPIQIDHFTLSDPVAMVTVPVGTSLVDAKAALPTTLEAVDDSGNTVSVSVTWTDGGLYNGSSAGDYVFTAELGSRYTYASPAPTAVLKVSAEESAQGKGHTISVTASDGSVIEVSGNLPEGATVEAEPMEVSQTELQGYLGESKAGAVKSYAVYDIRIMVDGEEWQPNESVSVTIKHPVIAMEQGETPNVAHIGESGTADSDKAVETKDDEFAFETKSFSPFVFYTFTVDFHYNDITYSIPGNSSVLLSEVFSALAVEKNAADAVSVTFSDPELIAVTKAADDWQLTSLQAFSTDETLTIRFADGSILEIATTDAAIQDLNPGVAANAQSMVARGGDSNSFSRNMPFGKVRIYATKMDVNGSNCTVSNMASGISVKKAIYDPGNSVTNKKALFYGAIAKKTSKTINGTVAVLTFKDAAVDYLGNSHDVRITLSDLYINNASNSDLTRVSLLGNQCTLFSFGFTGGNTVPTDVNEINVKINMTIEVIGVTSGTNMIMSFYDLDQPSRQSGDDHYSGAYSEQLWIVQGALTKAYIPQNSLLNITTTLPNRSDAVGLKLRGTAPDSNTYKSGFALGVDASKFWIQWKGGQCGTPMFIENHIFEIRPLYTKYYANGQKVWTSGNTGGSIARSDTHDGSYSTWAANETFNPAGYCASFFCNYKSSTLKGYPATGYRLLSVTRNSGANADPLAGRIVSTPQNANWSIVDNPGSNTYYDAFYEPITSSIKIHKQDQSGKAMSGVKFTVSGTSSVHGAFTLTGTTNTSGDAVISNIPYGSASDVYTITETVPNGYTAETLTQTFHFSTTQQNFTFVNYKDATIHIKKVISNYTNVPEDVTKAFTMQWAGTTDTTDTIMTVTNAGGTTINNVKTEAFSSTTARDISLTEVLPALAIEDGRYELASIKYSTTGFDTGTVVENGGNIPVSSGQDVYITVTNNYIPPEAEIWVKKVISNYSGYGSGLSDQEFIIKLSGDVVTDVTLKHNETSKKIKHLIDGASDIVKVSEVVPMEYSTGYTVSAEITHIDGTHDTQTGQNITVLPGDKVLITVTNTYVPKPFFKIKTFIENLFRGY